MPAEYTAIFLVDNHAEYGGEYNRNLFFIIVGDGNRQWFQSSYIARDIKPIGKIDTIIPEGPAHPNALLDACIAFAPEFFESCSTLNEITSTISDGTYLDFNISNIPEKWNQLREEARPIYEKKIRILHFPIIDKPLDLDGKYNKLPHSDE